MQLPEGVVLLDSLGDIKADNTSPILVCGSHCGGNSELANHISNCNVKAVFLNNAGIGKNQAGIRGLAHYEAANVLACAVDRNSAEIGIARDTFDSGIISHSNAKAIAAGINIGDTVQQALAKLTSIIHQPLNSGKNKDAKQATADEERDTASNAELKKQSQTKVDDHEITVCDSITFLNEGNVGDIVVCGSHGGLSAGHYAQKHRLKAVFFNDAGIGKNNAGTKSLDLLNESGICACTVDCMSAEIFNGQDVLSNGIVSVCNQLASAKGIKANMSVKEAVKCIGAS